MSKVVSNIRRTPIVGDLLSRLKSEVLYIKSRKTLLLNKRFEGRYFGKRCFIIGNGPSLLKQDLLPLINEYTFTVNSFTATKEFDIVRPKFHVMVDSTRFDESYEVFNRNLENLSKNKHKPVCIFPLRFQKYFESKGYDKSLEIIYVYPSSKSGTVNEIDFTKKIPPYQNVINVALYSAISLGFSEIYLIGCDMTGLVKVYDDNDNIEYGGHFYEYDNNQEKSTMDKLHAERSNEFMLKAYGYVFELFRLTNDYAVKKGVKIYNATKGGTLDVFPRVKFEDLIK